jgi:hypothetical protein
MELKATLQGYTATEFKPWLNGFGSLIYPGRITIG